MPTKISTERGTADKVSEVHSGFYLRFYDTSVLWRIAYSVHVACILCKSVFDVVFCLQFCLHCYL